MPHSLMLECYPTERIDRERIPPKALHGLFFRLVESVDPQLSERLHEQTRKAFTISPLRAVRSKQAWAANGLHTIRFTTLDDRVFQALSRFFLERLSVKLRMPLGSAEIVVTRLLASPHNGIVWSNYQTYEQIWAEASAEETRMALRFYSPTAFKIGDDVLPLPAPELVFASYLQRWNAFSAHSLPEAELMDAVKQCVVISHHNIATEKLEHMLGFTGTVVFEIRHSPSPVLIKQLNALADYAYYCGTGHKTPMGCGWTRRLANNAE